MKKTIALVLASVMLLAAFPASALAATASASSDLSSGSNVWITCKFSVAYQPNDHSPSYWVVSNLNWNATNNHLLFSQDVTYHDAKVWVGTSLKISNSCSTRHTVPAARVINGVFTSGRYTHNFPPILINVLKGTTYGTNHNHGMVGLLNDVKAECTGTTPTFN